MDKNFEKGRCPYAFNFFNGGLSEDNLYPLSETGLCPLRRHFGIYGCHHAVCKPGGKGADKSGVQEVNGTLSLTIAGEKVAENVYERHCFFREKLLAAGVDLQTAEKDACRMEHGISEESFRKVKKAQES